MQGNESNAERTFTPTLSYARLLERLKSAQQQGRPLPPVAVLARLLHLSGRIGHHGTATVFYFTASVWQRLTPEHQQYVRQALRRYRDLYAVVPGG